MTDHAANGHVTAESIAATREALTLKTGEVTRLTGRVAELERQVEDARHTFGALGDLTERRRRRLAADPDTDLVACLEAIDTVVRLCRDAEHGRLVPDDVAEAPAPALSIDDPMGVTKR